MYKFIIYSLMTLFMFSVQAQINLPAGSSAASVTTTVGLTEVSIKYFRPKMRVEKYLVQMEVPYLNTEVCGGQVPILEPPLP